jgi:hypothetical protein
MIGHAELVFHGVVVCGEALLSRRRRGMRDRRIFLLERGRGVAALGARGGTLLCWLAYN